MMALWKAQDLIDGLLITVGISPKESKNNIIRPLYYTIGFMHDIFMIMFAMVYSNHSNHPMDLVIKNP